MKTVENFKCASLTETAQCPVCDSTSFDICCKAQDYEYKLPGEFMISRCSKCGFLCQNPRPAFSEILPYYTEKYEPFKTGKGIMFALRNRFLVKPRIHKYENIASKMKCKARLLDVGCAHGDLLELLGSSSVLECEGVEPVKFAAEIARQRGLKVHCCALEDLNVPDESYDIIVMNHVLEHVPNPAEITERIFRLLKKGGVFIAELPCENSLERMIFGKYWGMYHLPRHLSFFSKKLIAEFLKRKGFYNIEIQLQPVPSCWQASVRNYLNSINAPANLVKVFSGHSAFLNLISFPITWLMAKIGLAAIMHFTAYKKSPDT